MTEKPPLPNPVSLTGEKQIHIAGVYNHCNEIRWARTFGDALKVRWEDWFIIIRSRERLSIKVGWFGCDDDPKDDSGLLEFEKDSWPDTVSVQVTHDHADALEIHIEGDPSGKHSMMFFAAEYDRLDLLPMDSVTGGFKASEPLHMFYAHEQPGRQ